ncbi:MAG: 2-amino-4-hydroxy-6-hydroxymethyldihydropteridine diphosphokinase [Cellvibrionaceae bacterium]
MSEVVIAIGSNSDREKHISYSLDSLAAKYGDLLISPVYESEAKKACEPNAVEKPYYNLVVCFSTDSSVLDLKQSLRKIETECDRERRGERVTLDLDLLLYDDWVGEVDNSAIPHHDISQCAYVLRPLADLLPEHSHPVYKKSYSDLWKAFVTDTVLYPIDFVWKDNVISVSACLQPI